MKTSGERLHSLDYLRGLCAFGIVIFHCVCHIFQEPSPNSFLAKVGLYGVSMFYILSGMTLFHVYHHKLNKPVDTLIFYIKRIFRIFPLLWICIVLMAILIHQYNPKVLIINFTGLFGFVYRRDYMVEGAWSIGNELYFYLLFPLLISLSKKATWISISFYVLTGLIGLYFAFVLLNPDDSLVNQWMLYIYPLNQYFLFTGGAAIMLFGNNSRLSNILLVLLLLLSVSAFILVPTIGDPISSVTGINRVVYSLCCFGIAYSILKLPVNLPKIMHGILGFMGKISYSIYLIHPIIIILVMKSGFFNDFKAIQMLIVLMLTFGLSTLVYYFIEEKFINLGGTISTRIKNRLNREYVK